MKSIILSKNAFYGDDVVISIATHWVNPAGTEVALVMDEVEYNAVMRVLDDSDNIIVQIEPDNKSQHFLLMRVRYSAVRAAGKIVLQLKAM